MHIWTASVQPWDHITDALPGFPNDPPIGIEPMGQIAAASK